MCTPRSWGTKYPSSRVGAQTVPRAQVGQFGFESAVDGKHIVRPTTVKLSQGSFCFAARQAFRCRDDPFELFTFPFP